ncbi:MAG: hypothetical protein ACRCSP_05040 [Rhodoglobus sp.]
MNSLSKMVMSITTTVLLLVGLSSQGASARPSATETSGPEIWLSGADGDSIKDILTNALKTQDADTIAAVLDSAAAEASRGTEVNFPGLEDVSTQEQAAILTKIADAVSNDVAVPRSIGDLTAIDAQNPVEITSSGPGSGVFGNPSLSLLRPGRNGLESPTIVPTSASVAQVSPPAATTPSQYISYGNAIANNRAWQWSAGFNVYRCNPFCTLTDRRELRSTITPGQFTVRVETSTLYSPNAGNIRYTSAYG